MLPCGTWILHRGVLSRALGCSLVAATSLALAGGCGTDEPFAAGSLDAGSGGTGGAGGGASGGSGGTQDAAPDAPGSDAKTGEQCVFDHEVTLPGHEGQFFGNANIFCRTFIAGIANEPLVVVGSDAAGIGDHDCVLDRAVRYHVDWGDGTCTWTKRAERCDRTVGAKHMYSKAGTYTAWVFAEDDDGLRTRKDDKVFTVHETGGDVLVKTGTPKREGDVVTFSQTLGAYGNLVVDKLTVAYRLQECGSKETELERREFPLPPTYTDGYKSTTTSKVKVTVPAGVVKGRIVVAIDPDETLTETCPKSGNPPDDTGLNNFAAANLEPCPALTGPTRSLKQLG